MRKKNYSVYFDIWKETYELRLYFEIV